MVCLCAVLSYTTLRDTTRREPVTNRTKKGKESRHDPVQGHRASHRKPCPDCQDNLNSLDVRSDHYGMGRHTTAHLYAVSVLAAFDAIRDCSHCRRNPADDNCKAWREARESVSVLTQESRRLVKGVDELLDATGGRTANIYQFAGGSVAYFGPDAPDFQEAGELKGDDLAEAVRILNGSGVPGGNPVRLE